jgi:hypothetical protein
MSEAKKMHWKEKYKPKPEVIVDPSAKYLWRSDPRISKITSPEMAEVLDAQMSHVSEESRQSEWQMNQI